MDGLQHVLLKSSASSCKHLIVKVFEDFLNELTWFVVILREALVGGLINKTINLVALKDSTELGEVRIGTHIQLTELSGSKLTLHSGDGLDSLFSIKSFRVLGSLSVVRRNLLELVALLTDVHLIVLKFADELLVWFLSFLLALNELVDGLDVNAHLLLECIKVCLSNFLTLVPVGINLDNATHKDDLV